MPNSPAPIGLSVYARLQHLQRTVTALQKNILAQESELFVFSDAPKAGDEEKVEAVRNYLRKVNGFKEVTIIERTENNRLANNRGGMRMLLERYGKMIFLEEDIVTAPSFLAFMNRALDVYKHNDRILSVTGYCPPIRIPDDYPYDAFLLPRFCAWGFGIWKDRFDRIPMVLGFDDLKALLSPLGLYRFCKGGTDMLPMVAMEAKRKIDALDVKCFVHQFRTEQYTLYPRSHLVENIGHDGSGVHCRATDRFNVDLSTEQRVNFVLPPTLAVDDRISEASRKYRSRGIGRTVMHLLRAAWHAIA